MKPVDILLSKVDFRCTKCGAKQGACNCWEKVTLKCPTCGKEKKTHRDKTDPPGTVLIRAQCPDCTGEIHPVEFFNAKGRRLLVSPQKTKP